MGIDKIAKELSKGLIFGIGIPITVSAGAVAGMNFYIYHNANYETGSKRILQKADGIMGHTEITINEGGSIEVVRYNFLNGSSKFYTDYNNDGAVDEVFRDVPNKYSKGSHFRGFYRDAHLQEFPDIFQEADRDFRQQIQRFKPFMSK